MANGASIGIERLLLLRHHARSIALNARSNALSQLAGQAKTHFRGRGLDFEEVRHYQAGDEPRAIDWRVTARTGVPHTKLFREERERPALVIVDQRQTMGFGSQRCFKSVQASELAGLLCWATLQRGDRIGGLVFNDSTHREIRPAKSNSTALQLLHTVAEYNHQLIDPAQQSDIASLATSNSDPIEHRGQINAMLQETRRIAKPGTNVFIVSDFAGLNDDGLKQLYLIKRHCDVSAFFVYDPMEQQLPAIGFAHFTDGKSRLGFDLNARQLRQSFSQLFEKRLEELNKALLSRNIPMVTIATTGAAIDTLKYYYHTGNYKR